MLAILCAHAVAALVAPVLVHRWGRRAFYPLALVPLGSLPWVALNWPQQDVAAGAAPGSGEQTVHLDWVPELSMDITLRFDALAAIMSVLVLAIGRSGPVLLRRVLPPPRRPPRTQAAQLRRRTGGVLRCHVRARRQRQHADALPVLGADDRAVVPPRRALRRARHQPARGHPGAARHHRGRAGDAGRHRHPRRAVRYLPAVGTGRRAAHGHRRRGRASSWCSSERCRSPRSCPSTSGCPARWRRPPRSAPICTRRRWSRPGSTWSPA